MGNLQDLFVKELKSNIKVCSKDIYKVPLPNEVSKWYVSGTDLYAVRGIEDRYFSALNKSIVRRVPRGYVVKRRKVDKATRSFMRDGEGKYVYENVSIPNGSMVIVSNKNLNLPYKYKAQEGYGYVDFVKSKGEIDYLYIVPKKVLYRVNQTALAISVKNMKNYCGMGYTTWDMGSLFIHVIPYNPNSNYIGSRILKTGHTLDYSKEINALVSYWEKVQLIPDIKLCKLSDGVNIIMKPTSVGYTDYVPVEILSMGDKEIYGEDSSAEGK